MKFSVKPTEHEIVQSIPTLLSDLCANCKDMDLELVNLMSLDKSRQARFDALAHVTVRGQPHKMAFEVKHNGQPRHVRDGILLLRDAIHHSSIDELEPVLVAPYLSMQSRRICKDHDTNYMDLTGNAYLALPGLLLDINTGVVPRPEKRALRSVFGLKGSSIIRSMLHDPMRSWRVTDLAQQSGTSLGMVSNVRRTLLDYEWAKVTDQGLILTKPDLVLDSWSEDYRQPIKGVFTLYSTLHGKTLETAMQSLFSDENNRGRCMYGSFSAAQWIAPYARTNVQFLVAFPECVKSIEDYLEAATVNSGANISVLVANDVGVFKNALEPIPGVVCTSAIQTYLDLYCSGDRGRESAEFLRQRAIDFTRS